jgi:hypothetical protein
MQKSILLYQQEMEKRFSGFNTLTKDEQDILKIKHKDELRKHFTIITQRDWFNNPLSSDDYDN